MDPETFVVGLLITWALWSGGVYLTGIYRMMREDSPAYKYTYNR